MKGGGGHSGYNQSQPYRGNDSEAVNGFRFQRISIWYIVKEEEEKEEEEDGYGVVSLPFV